MYIVISEVSLFASLSVNSSQCLHLIPSLWYVFVFASSRIVL